MTDKLQKFNAFGMVTVGNGHITVLVSAFKPDGKSINRTITHELEQPDFTGSALIAIDVEPTGYKLGIREIGETQIMEHPDVKRIFESAVDWLKISAGI